MTGRHTVRNGMYSVGFPYEYGGLAADEVTIGEVLTKQGFDEALWSPYNQMRTRHQLMIAKYPNKGQNRDFPFQNIENARPETIKASAPSVDPKDVPFDPRAWPEIGDAYSYSWALS